MGQANQSDNFGSVKFDNFGSVKLDNFASVKLDPTPLSEQNQTINKIMVSGLAQKYLRKTSITTRLLWDVLEFLRMYFKRLIPNDVTQGRNHRENLGATL